MKKKDHTSNPIAAGSGDTDSTASRADALEEQLIQQEGGVAGDTTAAAVSHDYEELKQRLSAAESSAAQAQSLYQRMAADFENYRKRIDRERQEFLNFGLQRATEALLPALDDLDRAQASLSAQMSPEDLLESINLVFNRMRRALEQIGVQPVAGVGEHFDPQFHEPVQKVETTEFPDGAVIEVLRKGYMLNGKVIRPALVNVASNNAAPEHEEPKKTLDRQNDLAESET